MIQLVHKLSRDEAEKIIYDEELDIRGEVCPYPVLKTKMKLKQMESGEILKIILDYPPSVENVLRATTEIVEHIGVLSDGGSFEIYVKKK